MPINQKQTISFQMPEHGDELPFVVMTFHDESQLIYSSSGHLEHRMGINSSSITELSNGLAQILNIPLVLRKTTKHFIILEGQHEVKK